MPTDTREADPDDPDGPTEHEHEDHRSADEGHESAPVPFAPDEDDDSPLGDTDQHSDA